MADPEFRERWKPFSHLHFIDTIADYTSHPAGDWWQQVLLPRLLHRIRASVLYSPAYVGPVYTGKIKHAVMLHDDLVWTQPETYPLKFRLYMRMMTALTARHAWRVLFPSDDARKRCSRRLRLPRKKTGVVPNAVDLEVFSPTPVQRREPIVLVVASPERRKNHDVLVRALRDEPRLRLRFIGIPAGHPRVEELRRIDPAAKWDLVPHADEYEIAAHMRRAAVLALPSYGEGFGMPVVEAIATGTPVVLSDIAVLHEVAGPAATYADPDDPAAWRQALLHAAFHSAAPDPAPAAAYSLEQCAATLLSELNCLG
jgi:glycosyltransferase involved in cell wall biosynthesis